MHGARGLVAQLRAPGTIPYKTTNYKILNGISLSLQQFYFVRCSAYVYFRLSLPLGGRFVPGDRVGCRTGIKRSLALCNRTECNFIWAKRDICCHCMEYVSLVSLSGQTSQANMRYNGFNTGARVLINIIDALLWTFLALKNRRKRAHVCRGCRQGR